MSHARSDNLHVSDADDAGPVSLSAGGRARREAILRDFVETGRRRVFRRRRRKVALALIGLLVIGGAGAAIWLAQRPPTSALPLPPVVDRRPSQAPPVHKDTPPKPPALPVRVVVIETDARATERYTKVSERSLVRVLDDDGLLAAMREAGRPVALARLDGRVALLPHLR